MRLALPGTCVLLMGASGSGKSTLAKVLAAESGAAVVSYDAHQRQQPEDDGRQAVSPQALAAAHAELATYCASGLPVIVDGTHCQADRRAAVRAIATEHGLATVVLVLLVPLAVCQERQRRRARWVPLADITRQHAAISAALPALPDEGHAAVVLLSAGAINDILTAARVSAPS